jgi:hypothetical protein
MMGVRTTHICWLVAAAVSVTTCLHASLVELADSGQWERLLLVANRRAEQLPLQPEEALLAANAARVVGDLRRARACGGGRGGSLRMSPGSMPRRWSA